MAFTTNVFLPTKSNRASSSISRRSAAPRSCAAAPMRKKTPKKSLPSKYFRALPDDLPVSERPPPPPTHYSVPYVGIFLESFLGLLSDGLMTLNKKYGPIYFSKFFLGPIVYVRSYGAAVDILKDDKVFGSEKANPQMEQLFGKDGILIIDGKQHEIARRALAPAFSTVLFPCYLKNVVHRTKETWKHVHETVQKDGKMLFDPMFREHYLAIIIEMTTGIAANSDRSTLICECFYTFLEFLTVAEFMPKYKRGMEARDKIRAILRDVILDNIANRRDIIEKLREYGDDIVKMGVKDIKSGNVHVFLVIIANSSLSTDPNAPIDEETVAALARTMVVLWIAGYVTSAITSTCGIFELGARDDILSRLVKEQDAIVGASAGEREVTYEQVQMKMPLLDSYIMEILRLFPAPDWLDRYTRRDVEILGKFVPKGTRLKIDLGPHTDEDVYENGDQIIPERWLQTPKPPAVLAFGAPGSAHYCIGASFAKIMMKTTFATLFREYEFGLDPKQSRKYRHLPDHVPESNVVVNNFERRQF